MPQKKGAEILHVIEAFVQGKDFWSQESEENKMILEMNRKINIQFNIFENKLLLFAKININIHKNSNN